MRRAFLTVLSFGVCISLVQGGVISIGPALTTDAASGISAANTYTHVISGGETVTVNSVAFDVVDPGTTPANFSWDTFTWTKNEVQNNNGDWLPAVGGVTGTGLIELFRDFTYSGNGTGVGNHQAFTLSGLTPGASYDLRLYVRSWDDANERRIDLTFSNGAEVDSQLIYEDQPPHEGLPSVDSAYYVSYNYTAQATSVTVDAEVAAGGNGSFHMYGLTNQETAPPPPTLVMSTAASTTGFLVSAIDLVEGLAPTVNDPNLVRVEEGATTTDLGALSNGAFGAPGLPSTGEVVAIHNGTVLTYPFDILTNPDGYDIFGIDTYTGWRDGGRDAQQYGVFYSLVSSPGSFLPLASVDYNPAYASPSDTMVQFAMSDGSAMLSRVAALRFEFPSTENTYVGYREIDVFGSPTIPEPTTMALLGLGLAVVARRRRR